MTININAQFAANMSRALGHECYPGHSDFESVSMLHSAMEQAADEYNESQICQENSWMKVAPWSYEHGSLNHCTGSGRMQIQVTNGNVLVGLYSPAWREGEKPFLTCFTYNSETLFIYLQPGAHKILKGRADRISHIWSYVLPAWNGKVEYIEEYRSALEQAVIRGQLNVEEHYSTSENYSEDWRAEHLPVAEKLREDLTHHVTQYGDQSMYF